MLRGMRKTLGACLAAGAVGLGASLAGAADAVPVSAGQVKLEAMKVELAWLADARAFNLSLRVVARPDGLELHGRVADEATRQHVLKLARQACYLPVRDALEVGQPCANPALRDAARTSVAAALAGRAGQVTVGVDPGGVVSLTGSVGSVEDKLEAGRALRGVSGCTRVDNRLEVAAVRRGGATLTAISRDGKQSVLGPVGAAGVVSVRADVPKDELPAPPRAYSADAAAPTLPSGPPPTQFVRIQVRHETVDPTPRPLAKPLVSGYATGSTATPDGLPGYPACDPCAGDVPLTAARVAPPPTLFSHLRGLVTPTKRAVVDAPPPAAAAPSPVRVVTEAAPVVSPEPVKPVPAPPPEPTRPAAVALTVPAAAPAVWPPAFATAPVTPYRPLPVPVAETPLPPVTPVAAKEPAEKAAPPAVAPAVMKVEKAKPTTPDQMRRAILAGCGKLVKDVKVETRPDGHAVYHLHASAKVEQELVAQLLTIPQVADSNAHIQIHLLP
ncbi:MAG: BON domain-containing protein [Gemmataceae bacterium]